MPSSTERGLTALELASVLRPLGVPAAVRPVTSGTAASGVTLTDGTRLVVKASRAGAEPYRHGCATVRTAAEVYTSLAGRGLPVPTVLHADFSRAVVDADVVVTTQVPGVPWSELDLDPAGSVRARRELGGLMARLHGVGAPGFGSPAVGAPGGEEPVTRWRAAFTAMVEAVLRDGADRGVELPARRVRSVLAAHGPALDAVAAPAVVHQDLWPANVLLDDDGTLRGVVGAGRAVWGDPLLDLVGADQFGLWDVDRELLRGNSAAGGVLAVELASATGPTRFALYRLYRSLVLATEADACGCGDLAGHRRVVRALVAAALDRLDPARSRRAGRAARSRRAGRARRPGPLPRRRRGR